MKIHKVRTLGLKSLQWKMQHGKPGRDLDCFFPNCISPEQLPLKDNLLSSTGLQFGNLIISHSYRPIH